MTVATDLLRRSRRRRVIAVVALAAVAAIGTAWVWSIDLWPASGPAVMAHGSAAGPAKPAQAASGALSARADRGIAVASDPRAAASHGGVPGGAADADCRASLSPLARLRAAAVALLPGDGALASLAQLAGRIETVEQEAAQASLALQAAAVGRLRASADPLQRAAGLAVMASPRPVVVLAPVAPAGSAASAPPAGDGLPVDQQPLAELAMLARGSADVRIYAWAWNACVGPLVVGRAPAPCHHLSAQRWAQLAPDSAAPWLALALQANQAGDVAGEWSAMHRASLATQWRPAGAGLLPLLLAALAAAPLPPSTPLPALVRLNAEMEALLVQHVVATPLVPRFCQRQQMQGADANRMALCTSLVERMLAQADDLLHFALGVSLAKGLVALPAQRLAAWHAELERLRATLAQGGQLERAAMGDAGIACAGIAALRQRIARVAADGELAVLRAEAEAASPQRPAAQ